MSVKRSRLCESSNLVEKDLFNHMTLPVESAREVHGADPLSDVQKPPKCLRPSLEGNKEQIWQNTVLKSRGHKSISGGIGSFLKHCYHCNKKIDQGEDVYMYRDLCAFCTEVCRDYQIELDEKIQKQSAESSRVVQEQDVNNLRNSSFLNH